MPQPAPQVPLAHTGRPLPPPPPLGRLTVFAVADGAPLSCYPVDAKELLESGAYVGVPPAASEPIAAAPLPTVAPPADPAAEPAGDESRPRKRK